MRSSEKMSQPKNHHYLPVFYLSRWCGKDGKITRYYRPFDKVVASPITPDNTGYEPFLYSFEGVPEHRRQMLETDFLAPGVDAPASLALAVLLDGAAESPTTRSDWARFMMGLRLRNPKALDEVHKLSASILRSQMSDPADREYLAVKEDGDPDTLLEWVERNMPHVLNNAGKIFLPDMIDHQEVGGHIVRMNWGSINFSRAGRTLLIGDRPYIATQGLQDPACVIALPLSPTRLFVATNDNRQIGKLLRCGLRHLAGCSTIKWFAKPLATSTAPARSTSASWNRDWLRSAKRGPRSPLRTHRPRGYRVASSCPPLLSPTTSAGRGLKG